MKRRTKSKLQLVTEPVSTDQPKKQTELNAAQLAWLRKNTPGFAEAEASVAAALAGTAESRKRNTGIMIS